MVLNEYIYYYCNMEINNSKDEQNSLLTIHLQVDDVKINQNQVYDQYCKFFEGSRHYEIHQLTEKISFDRGICFNPQMLDRPLKIKIYRYNTTFELLKMGVELGLFSLYMSAINKLYESRTHTFTCVHSFKTHIYVVDIPQECSCVVKCFPYRSENFAQVFSKVVKQYFLLSVASYLDIGPRIESIFGCDIQISDSCIEFAVQKCQEINELQTRYEMILKNKLKKLHLLHIIHNDIKSANIMYSPSIREPVYIDFGYSQVINNSPNEHTHTFFAGSLGFTSPQMMNLQGSFSPGWVNLYHNDVYGLKESFKDIIQHQQKQRTLKCLMEDMDFYSDCQQIQNSWATISQQIVSNRCKFYLFDCRQFPDSETMNHFLKESDYFLEYMRTLPNLNRYKDLVYKVIYPYFKAQRIQISTHISQVYTNNTFFKPKPTPYNWIVESSSQNQLAKRCLAIYPGIVSSSKPLKKQMATKMVPLKDSVLVQEIGVQKLESKQFLIEFILFVDLTVNRSTFSEKVDASHRLCEKTGLDTSQKEQEDLISHCLLVAARLLFDRTQTSSQDGHLVTVLTNLIILGSIDRDELEAFCHELAFVTIPTYRKMVVLLHAFHCGQWIIAQVSPKYSKYKLHQIFYKAFVTLLNETLIQGRLQRQVWVAIDIISIMFSENKCLNSALSWNKAVLVFRNQSQALGIDENTLLQLSLMNMWLRMGKTFDRKEVILVLKGVVFINDYDELQGEEDRFRYYHFHLFQYYHYRHNYQMVHNLFRKMQNCLGNQRLLKKYLTFYRFEQACFMRNKLSIESYSTQLLQCTSLVKNSHLLHQLYSLLVSANFKKSQPQVKLSIRNLLLSSFKPYIFNQFSLPQSPKTDRMDLIFDKWAIIAGILYNLYIDKSIIEHQVQLVLEKLIRLYDIMWCQECRSVCLMTLVRLKAEFQEHKGNPEGAIEIYQDYFYLAKESDYYPRSVEVYVSLLSETLRISVQKVPKKMTQSCELYLSQVWRVDHFWDIIVGESSFDLFKVINWYLLMDQQRVEDYITVQYRLLLQIKYYPYEQEVNNFVNYTLYCLQRWPSQITRVQQAVITGKQIKNSYVGLFYSLYLRYQQAPPASTKRIWRRIYDQLPTLSTFARTAVLDNIYFKLMSRSCKTLSQKHSIQRYQYVRQLRLYRYRTRLYFKYCSFFIIYEEFMANLKLSKQLSSHDHFTKSIKKCLQKIHKTVNSDESLFIRRKVENQLPFAQ